MYTIEPMLLMLGVLIGFLIGLMTGFNIRPSRLLKADLSMEAVDSLLATLLLLTAFVCGILVTVAIW
jgi:hypothetical protein